MIINRWKPTGGNNKFGGDQNIIVSANVEGYIYHHHARTGTLIDKIYDPNANHLSMDFSSDGKFLATGAVDAQVRIYDPETRQLVKTFGRAGWNT